MIGLGSDGNIEQNQIIAMLSSVLCLVWMFIFSWIIILVLMKSLTFSSLYLNHLSSSSEMYWVNLANGFESLLLLRGIQRSHLQIWVSWLAEIIYIWLSFYGDDYKRKYWQGGWWYGMIDDDGNNDDSRLLSTEYWARREPFQNSDDGDHRNTWDAEGRQELLNKKNFCSIKKKFC